MQKLSPKDIKQNLIFKTTSDKPNHTLTWFKSLIDDSQMNLNPSYQRGEVWSEEGMKALIISLISGIAIPPIILNERTDDDDNIIYDVMDGKQRLTTILNFINNKYHINLNDKNVYYEQDLNNTQDYSFDDKQTKRFMDIEIQTVIYKNLEESQQRDIFERINYGSPLKLGEKLKGSNGTGVSTIKEIIDKYSTVFEEKLYIKNERHSNYLKFAAIIALIQKKYKHASSGAPVLKYVKEKLKYDETIIQDTCNIINKLLELHGEIYDYHISRTAKKYIKLWNWSDIMFMVYILSNKNFKDVVKFNKFLWHLKNNSIKINEWDCNELNVFNELWKKIGRKNTNNEDVYVNRSALFDKIILWINKKIPSSLREEIALKKFRDSDKKNCPVCNTHTIEKSNYQAGHIISRKNGGLIYFNNIIPICQTCNTSMGSKDLDIYCEEKGITINF